MKSYFFLFLLCCGTLFLTTGCGDDDADGGNGTNVLVYDGTTYNLSQGFLEDYGDNGNGTFDFDVLLFSDGITYNPATEEFSGEADGLYLDLNTSDPNGLVAGTYNFSATREDFSFIDGEIYLDFNLSTFTGQTISVTGGSVTVGRDGNATTFDFNLTAAGGQAVTGNFSGVLIELED